jgi:Ca2+-binding EF-hand superfamily protein
MSRKLFLTSLIMFGASQAAVADEEKFKQLDMDQSGTISAEEAVAMEGLQETMAEYDLNGDRELDKEEFALFIETIESNSAS